MSTTQNALTAHVLVEDLLKPIEIEKLKGDLKHQLEHLNIHHATLETEQANCIQPDCDGDHHP